MGDWGVTRGLRTGRTTLPAEDWVKPPPALPDGSMPSYDARPLPGMPGGDPPHASYGWGPEFGDDDEYPLGPGRPPLGGRRGVLVGLLVVGAVAVAALLAVLMLK